MYLLKNYLAIYIYAASSNISFSSIFREKEYESFGIQINLSTLQYFLTLHIFVTKPWEHCIIIFLDILDFVEKLKVEMARRKIDSYSPHNKIFIPWEKARPKDIRRKWMPINGRDDRGSVYIRKKYSPHPSTGTGLKKNRAM